MSAPRGESTSPVLSLRDVAKRYGGAVALRGVSMDVFPGEVHAVMGMNGAGKSTLVQILAGAHRADEGAVVIDGVEHTQLSPREARALGISTVPQRRDLVVGLTVAENIMLGHLPRRGRLVNWSEVRSGAAAALADLEIDIDVTRVAGDLTVAEQTMVEIAREAWRGGRVLILDEPTASLGAEAAQCVRELVRKLRAQGVAIILISHYIDEVLAMSDRVTVLRDGALVKSVLIDEVDESGLVRLMVGRDVVSARPEKRTARTGAGLELNGLRAGREVSELTLAVAPGEVVAVLGPAGDAQSVLFDVLSGRRRPDAGQLGVGGQSVDFGSIRRSLASGLRCVTGDRLKLGLHMGLSVDENVMLAQDRFDRRRLHRRGRLQRKAARVRQRYGVTSIVANPPVGTLSGGNQQKVLLGKWLATGSIACFLEEPTNGVDVSAKAEIHTIVDALAGEGTAVLLASSSAEEVLRLADRIIVVRGGRVVAQRRTEETSRDELVALVTGGKLS